MHRKIIFTAAILLLGARLALAGGANGAKALNLDAGARPAGMGEAFTAVSDDSNALYYNPAGIAQLESPEAALTYFRGIVDENVGQLALSGKIGGIGKFGLGAMFYDGGNLEWNRLDGTSVTVKAQKDISVNLGYGVEAFKNLSIGLGVKYLSSKLVEKYSATAFAGDIGLLYKTGIEGLSAGAAVQNAGTKLKYLNTGDSLTMNIRGGISYGRKILEEHSFIAALDAVKPGDGRLAGSMGVEYSYLESYFLRCGHRFNNDLNRFALGAGYRTMGVGLDYAITALSSISPIHRVSVTYKF